MVQIFSMEIIFTGLQDLEIQMYHRFQSVRSGNNLISMLSLLIKLT